MILLVLFWSVEIWYLIETSINFVSKHNVWYHVMCEVDESTQIELFLAPTGLHLSLQVDA